MDNLNTNIINIINTFHEQFVNQNCNNIKNIFKLLINDRNNYSKEYIIEYISLIIKKYSSIISNHKIFILNYVNKQDYEYNFHKYEILIRHKLFDCIQEEILQYINSYNE